MDTDSIAENLKRRIPPIPTGKIDKSGTQTQITAGLSDIAKGTADSFVSIAKDLVIKNVKNAPTLALQNVTWLAPLVLIWLFLGTANRLYLLPGFLSGILSAVIFLTATYNNFVGKALYAGFIGREVVPFIKKGKASGFGATYKEYISKYTKVAGTILKAFKEKGTNGYLMLAGYGGAGFIVSNFLSRNNKSFTYLVCLLTALGIFSSLSRGLNDNVVKLVTALWSDIVSLIKKEKRGASVSSIYVAMSSFAAGLALSVVFWFIRVSNAYTDPTGYIFGSLLIVVSVIIYFNNLKKGTLMK